MISINQLAYGYEIKFAYRPHLVTGVKRIPGAKYNGADKTWTVPLDSYEDMIKWAKSVGFTQDDTVKQGKAAEIDPLPELTVDIPLKGEMFPFQKNGVAYGLEKERLIIGDEPGLGKTVQAIAMTEYQKSPCTLVICPATLKNNWKHEIENKWTHRKALILTDRTKTSWMQYVKVGMVQYIIVNYESLKKYFVDSIDRPVDKQGDPVPIRLNHIHFKPTIDMFTTIIIDEVHRCKETKTMQSKLVKGICNGKKYIYALTGTALVNKPADLIPQLSIIQQLDKFGGYKGFTSKFCQGFNQASNLAELRFLLHRHCFYRRLKNEVLKDLPDKVRETVKVDITTRDEYNKAETSFIAYLRENLGKNEGEITKSLRGEVMVRIGILKKISARGKIDQVVEHITEVTDAEEKIVVFAWHTDIVIALKEKFPNSLTIVGSDSLEQRDNSVKAFQTDDNRKIIICNIKSGGVGLTLTAASRVIFIEQPWHPADCNQCEDRCHRIGQKDSVQASQFVGENTIDEHIMDIIARKRNIVNQVMDGSADETTEQEMSMVDELINIYA